jgi:predicted  nucleic acid-binding Zn-ribbon protein
LSLYLKQIEQLVALQKVDDEIFVIRSDMENAPKEVEELRARFAALGEARDRHLEKLGHLREQAKRLDLDIDTDTDRLKSSKSKLMQVGNAKEYHAMMREMDSLERSTRSREEERMTLVEEVERQNASLAGIETEYAAMKRELDEKEGSLEDRVGEATARLATLDRQRADTGREVPAPVFARYEFIRQRLPYPVIVPVNGGVCSGCHIAIPPQGYIELQKGAQILSCPNCQRLIYWSEHFTAP